MTERLEPDDFDFLTETSKGFEEAWRGLAMMKGCTPEQIDHVKKLFELRVKQAIRMAIDRRIDPMLYGRMTMGIFHHPAIPETAESYSKFNVN